MLVLFGRVSVTDAWEIHKVLPVLMGRNDDNLFRGTRSVDAGDLGVILAKVPTRTRVRTMELWAQEWGNSRVVISLLSELEAEVAVI